MSANDRVIFRTKKDPGGGDGHSPRTWSSGGRGMKSSCKLFGFLRCPWRLETDVPGSRTEGRDCLGCHSGCLVAQSCLIFGIPWAVACQAPVHWILQARILEWVAFPFSMGSSWPRDQTQVSCIASRFFTIWATWEAPEEQHRAAFSGDE